MKSRCFVMMLCAVGLAAALTLPASAQEVKMLAITSSAGFEHSVVQREKGELGFAEKILVEIGQKNGILVVPTKDGGLINAEVLKQFDVLFFYTTGELQNAGKDGSIPMNAERRKDIIEFVKNGGGFVGSHTCTDTFHEWAEDGQKPYIELVGGEFASHGAQETGYLKVLDHPITAHLDKNVEWALQDEWYIFKNVNNSLMPLMILQTKKMEQEQYNTLEPYSVCGVKDFGNGRVFTCALGHREDVWTSPKFQDLMVNGIKWAAKKLK